MMISSYHGQQYDARYYKEMWPCNALFSCRTAVFRTGPPRLMAVKSGSHHGLRISRTREGMPMRNLRGLCMYISAVSQKRTP